MTIIIPLAIAWFAVIGAFIVAASEPKPKQLN